MLDLIGRQDVLNKIYSLINEYDSQHIVCIEADGGIGKTRLLQEIVTKYQGNNSNIEALDIFDFDDRDSLSPKYVGMTIAKHLGIERFHKYFYSQQRYQQMMIAGINSTELKQFSKEVRKKFKDCFNNISATKRILLCFDTTEKLESEKGMWQEIKGIIQLQNVCVLLAGRNAHQVGDWLQKEGISVKKISLLPLNNEESRLYLQRKQESIYIARLDDETTNKLVVLSAGKPILLDLAVEWICQELSLKWILDIPFNEVGGEHCRRKFESSLVKQIKEIRRPVDRLAQIMAYIYPLDREIIKHFMGIDTQILIEKISKYVFIKQLPGGYISLHDEVRRMVREHVYPLSNEEYLSEIKEYSKEAMLYCKEKYYKLRNISKEITDSDARADIERQMYNLMERIIEYSFFFDTEEGIKNYSDFIWKLRRDGKISFALRIQEQRKNDLEKLTEQQKRRYDVLRARLLNDSGNSELSEIILENLLKNKTNDKEKADICNALAPVKFRLGKLHDSLHFQLRSLRFFEKTNREYLPDLANYAGYLYERTGNFNNAIECYQKALVCCVSTTKKYSRELTAKILDNLSHACCQQGLFAESQNYLDQAKRMLSVLKNESSIARAEITQAVIYRDQGRHEEALECLKEAIKRLREPDDHQKLIKAFFHRGWTCWFQALEFDENSKEGKTDRKNKLKKSKQYFERSLELAECYHLKSELPGILHQLSNVYFLLGEKERAVAVNNKSYDLSCEVHDIRYAIDSLVGKAEFDYENGQYDNIAEYAQVLHNEYEEKGYDFPRFYGQMKRILADVAFDRQDYDIALNHYIDGLAQIRLHSGYGIYTIDNELERLEKRMQLLSDETFSSWCVKMAEEWSARQPHDKYILLLSWCNSQQLARLQ